MTEARSITSPGRTTCLQSSAQQQYSAQHSNPKAMVRPDKALAGTVSNPKALVRPCKALAGVGCVSFDCRGGRCGSNPNEPNPNAALCVPCGPPNTHSQPTDGVSLTQPWCRCRLWCNNPLSDSLERENGICHRCVTGCWGWGGDCDGVNCGLDPQDDGRDRCVSSELRLC